MAKKRSTKKKANKKVAKKPTKKKISKKAIKKKASKKVVKKKKVKKSSTEKTRKIVIQVNDLKGLAKHVQANVLKKQQEEKNQIIESTNFWAWLKKQNKLNLETFKIDFNDPIYRVYPSQFSVTSMIGSISTGARLNIGANQVLKQFFPFNMFGAVYFATTMNCAISEYCQGTPLSANDVKYTLQPVKTFELWDLDKVVQTLTHPSINLLVSKLPIGGGWSGCKVPMPSQILSHWLRAIGGDGIAYISTKDSSAKIIALFVKDDKESSDFLNIINQTNI